MLRETIKAAMLAAAKEQNLTKATTLRMIMAAIKQKDIDARPAGNADGIGDAEILQLLQSMVKQRNDSIQQFKAGGRDDLAAKEQVEIDLIRTFLPQQMSSSDLEAAVKKIIATTNASGPAAMGAVMAQLKSQFAGQMDMGQASQLVKKLLSGAA